MAQPIQVETQRGQPVTAHGVTVVPISQAVRIQTPLGVWVWNRPVGLNVERDGRYERIPVWDATRVAQFTLYMLAFFSLVLLLMHNQTSQENKHG